MLNILTSVIGTVAKGPAAKAIAAAIPGLIGGAFLGPEVVEAFQLGLTEAGTVPAAYSLGAALGALVVGGINYAIAYIAPANTAE